MQTVHKEILTLLRDVVRESEDTEHLIGVHLTCQYFADNLKMSDVGRARFLGLLGIDEEREEEVSSLC